MLDTDTKRRIDTARDILVGKVPDPKSQVEQITIALIYKFMDDIDSESEELGGERTFFAGEFARHGWARLMRSGLSGHEMLGLYAEAIARMPENPGIPPLFRSIFDNAYLPYRDPETLRAFLKVVDEFAYDHSERLGDAFEYLLSVMDVQGDAGQFRTPRHIIDFIVAIVDPQKHESVLDPACGTAGFLISAYKHILTANTGDDGNTTLTPDDRNRLAANFTGYDISPDMVRLSRVNMYLHDFADPHISEYDTLTSEDRWGERADVILANPPFMSPKGGIRPHNRFSVKSKRSEVLFVDYMAEHLTPTGRAGIIVPEGIVFQSQNAHTQLRKMLVEDCLVAVVSLPAGIFQPYSGVKTSILILDRSLARRTDRIAFFKVENDGFDLGAQRRPIMRNDLPQVQAEITEYLRSLRSAEPADTTPAAASSVAETRAEYTAGAPKLGMVIEKARIAADGGYALSGERYRENAAHSSHFPTVRLCEAAEVIAGQSPPGESYNGAGIGTPFYQGKTEFGEVFIGEPTKWTTDPRRFADEGDILMSVRAPVGPVNLATSRVCIGRGLAAIRPKKDRLLTTFAFYLLRSLEPEITGNAGAAFASINKRDVENIQIPLPPLEVQKDIVAGIDGYQKVIDGARAVIDNYSPHIPIDPDWPMVELRHICEINPEILDPRLAHPDQTIFYVDISSVENETGRFLGYSQLESSKAPTRARRGIRDGDVLLSTVRPNLKAFTILDEVKDRAVASTGFAVLRVRVDLVEPTFLLASLHLDHAVNQMVSMMGKGSYPSINQSDVASIRVSVPPLSIQEDIVAEIKAEQALVSANRELVERMERKIATTIGRVWAGTTGELDRPYL